MPSARRPESSVGMTPDRLAGSGRRPPVPQARAGIAFLWVDVCGHPARPLTAYLGVQPAAVLKAAHRGAQAAARWRALLAVKR